MNINLSSGVATTQLQPIDSEENTWQVYMMKDNVLCLRSHEGLKIKIEFTNRECKSVMPNIKSGYKHGDKLTIDFTIGE